MADLNRLVSIEDLRQVARRRLPRAIFDFFDGGAEDEVTLRENRAAFERVRLLPKVLVNVAKVDMSAELFGVRATLRAPDRFGQLLAAGITGWIVGQAIINVGAVTGALPVTGVPLPFVSFGGSALLFTMCATGVLLNVARQGR